MKNKKYENDNRPDTNVKPPEFDVVTNMENAVGVSRKAKKLFRKNLIYERGMEVAKECGDAGLAVKHAMKAKASILDAWSEVGKVIPRIHREQWFYDRIRGIVYKVGDKE